MNYFPEDIIGCIARESDITCAKLAQTCRAYARICQAILEDIEVAAPAVSVHAFPEVCRHIFGPNPLGIECKLIRNTLTVNDPAFGINCIIHVKAFAGELLIHRGDDLPAIIDASGLREWWFAGKRHREDDKPAVTCDNKKRSWCPYDRLVSARHMLSGNSTEWWFAGKKHRDNGKPAFISESAEMWFVDGEPYRENGPELIRKTDNVRGYYEGEGCWRLRKGSRLYRLVTV